MYRLLIWVELPLYNLKCDYDTVYVRPSDRHEGRINTCHKPLQRMISGSIPVRALNPKKINIMKKILITIAFIAFSNLNAQVFVSASFDPINTKTDLNYLLTIGATSNKKVIVSISHERHDYSRFSRWGLEVGKEIKVFDKTFVTITADLGSVFKGYSGWYYIGGNSNISYQISEKTRVFFKTQIIKRSDLENKPIRVTNFIGIQFNLY